MSESVALFQAIQAGDAATVTDLIEARAELLSASSPSGLSPLLFAAYYHRPQMAALLMSLGAPVSVFEAAAVGAEEKLKAVLEAEPALLYTPELMPAEHPWIPLKEGLVNRAWPSLQALIEWLDQRCVWLMQQHALVSNLTSFHWLPAA